MAVLTGTASARVQGLPRPSDNFPRRFRNRAPLAIRQIISQSVLDQWSSDPEHVIQALNQSVQEQQQLLKQAASKDNNTLGCGAKQETVSATGADPAVVLLPYLGSSQHDDDAPPPPLPVMVAEDAKNFMDDPQFTKTITMTAKEIVGRVLAPKQHFTTAPISSGIVSAVNGMEVINNEMDRTVPSLQIQDPPTTGKIMSQEVTVAPSWICPLCENQAMDQARQHQQQQHEQQQQEQQQHSTSAHDSCSRFYYRGAVPSSLYKALQLPDLLSSLSLPTRTTPFANAPNKDLMRIWISLAGATTPLHYDRCHGILIQLVGRKRFVVFSHEDTNGLYPYDGISGPGHASKVRGLAHCFPFAIKTSVGGGAGGGAGAVDSSSAVPPSHAVATAAAATATEVVPDVGLDESLETTVAAHLETNQAEVLRRWPKVRNTTPWVVDLEPGDALYTPPGFWHEVTSVDHSISITVPWDMDASELEHVPRHMF
ncbi:hypothetical protein EC968_010079 [Mortierella alpina]|nr:hypothetical protein EC968_010079 [Mortierella alpina]